MKRREALKGSGALATTAAIPKLLTGCGDNSSGGVIPDFGGITTMVVVMMENRSYDHILGARALAGFDGDGLIPTMANLNSDGSEVRVFADSTAAVPDPPHSWNSSHRQWDGGRNSGFLTEYRRSHGQAIPPHTMGYLTRTEQPFTWALADHYAIADRWFSSILGPTWPNRFYLHSGQSGGQTINEIPNGGISWPSIEAELTAANVPWRYYFSNLPVVSLFDDVTGAAQAGMIARVGSFFNDAKKGILPAVSFVDPAFFVNDDHPPQDPMLGQQFLASIYTALANSPQWKNCLLVITYDEHGGFFDHVSPPTTEDVRADQGFGQLGFRVPTLVAGPYVKTGYVSSLVYDHSSVIAEITEKHQLSPLTARDAAANHLADFIDTERLEAGQWAPPAALPGIEITESMVARAQKIRAVNRIELDDIADSGFFGNLDARGQVTDRLFEIGDFLDAHNAGRIRRGQ